MIIANVYLSSNLTKAVTGPAISDFVILKAFRIDTHDPNVPKIMEVFWHPPSSIGSNIILGYCKR